MEKGVDVQAVARGTVLRFREGEPDGFKTSEEKEAIRNARKECGNGLIIDHGEGWISQYCNLKNGSISVKENEKVHAGQKVALVGMSGITDHPHVHLSILYKGKHVDPFTGQEMDSGCSKTETAQLWRSKSINYAGFSLYDAGFIAQKPDFSQISKGHKEPYPQKDSDVIIFWSAYFGAKPNDVIEMKVFDPHDRIITEHIMTQKEEKARQYYYIGKKRPESGWVRGTYHAEVSVTRADEVQVIKKALDIY